MASVGLEHVDKIYPGGTQAVVDFSLRIADGELLVLVGPSGSGKSTVLRMIAGLDDISRGRLLIGDRLANDLSPQQRNVAMVFQDYALYPHMTVRGNLEFPLKMRRLSREEMQRRVAWAAELLDIGVLLDRLPKQLSGGQRQRVAMGRALVREPAVFLLDEPLSNLDAKLRVQVRAEIAELQQRMKTTMVYVTHDQTEAMTLGDRVAVLKDGRLQQVGTPVELYEQPANAFVAGFIGNPPMNLFPAAVNADGLLTIGDQQVAVELGGRAPEKVAKAGIRPEDFIVDDGGGLRATVGHVEWLGHETLAHVTAGSGEKPARLVVRLRGMRELRGGDPISLRVKADRVHFFDESGARL
jgi:multiple sugar transport system ATP-binding protein